MGLSHAVCVCGHTQPGTGGSPHACHHRKQLPRRGEEEEELRALVGDPRKRVFGWLCVVPLSR